ncbi:hypothetical protein BDFB_008768, partial [Asbolus verrucosus]
MENGLILCMLALKNFRNISMLTLLFFLIKTFIFLESKRIDKKKSASRNKIDSEFSLTKSDFVPKVNYCEWFLYNMNDDILDVKFFTDEAWFHLEGYVNSQNMRTWSTENPPSCLHDDELTNGYFQQVTPSTH